MIQLFAEGIEQRYPLKNYEQAKISEPPIEWAREGRVIAESFVYQVQEYSRPAPDYIVQGRSIMEERLALAGYRLAAMLNSIYNISR
jgi:hypothetical protein